MSPVLKAKHMRGTCDLCQAYGEIYYIPSRDECLCEECFKILSDDADPLANSPCPVFEECKKYRTPKQKKRERRKKA